MSQEYELILRLNRKVLVGHTSRKLFGDGHNDEAKIQECEDIVMKAWEGFLTNPKYAQLWEQRDSQGNEEKITNILKGIIFYKITDHIRSKKDFLKQQPNKFTKVGLEDYNATMAPTVFGRSIEECLHTAEEYLKSKGLKSAEMTCMMFHIKGELEGDDLETQLKNWNAKLAKPITLNGYQKKINRIRKKIGDKREDDEWEGIVWLILGRVYPWEVGKYPIDEVNEALYFSAKEPKTLLNWIDNMANLANKYSLFTLYAVLDFALCLLVLLGVFIGLKENPVSISSIEIAVKTKKKPIIKVKQSSDVPAKLVETHLTDRVEGEFEPLKDTSSHQAPLGREEKLNLIAAKSMYSELKDSLSLSLSKLLNPVVARKENKTLVMITATELPGNLSQAFQQSTLVWPAKLTAIASLKNSYAKAKRSYQKIAQRLTEYTRYLKNKRQVISKPYNYKRQKHKGVGIRANRFRPNKRQKAKMRRIAQRKRNRAKKQGRKKVHWRTQMNALNKEMRRLQKQVLKQTFTLLAVKQSESENPILLQPKNAFTLAQLEGLVLGFALPEQIQEPLQFKLYTLDKTVAQPKQLLLQAALKSDARGIVQQYISLKEHRLSAKSNYLIIEIVKKRKKYRDERLLSYRFQVGQ